MFDTQFTNFLITAKKETYAGSKNYIPSSRPKSHDLMYDEGDYTYIDTYMGGLKFIGEEVVWKSNNAIWGMNYIGRVIDESFDGDFLKLALTQVDESMPFRGPKLFKKGDYTYTCSYEGNLHWFKGTEQIFVKDVLTYECLFHGGEIQD